MAHDEACQLYIKQEIERGLEEGRTPYSIGKDLSKWIEKLFETSIPATTLKMQAERMKQNIVTNVTSQLSTENNTEKEEKPDIFNKNGCGGPGRPPQYQEKPKPYSCAEQMVDLAKSQLMRIPKSDPKREWAKQEIIAWANTNL